MATAAIPPLEPEQSRFTDMEARAVLDRAARHAQANECGAVLGSLDPALPRFQGRTRNAAQLLRIPCLASTGRAGEIPAVYAELVAADPRNPLVRNVGVIVSFSTGKADEAAARLASLAEEDPTALGRLDGSLVRGLFQTLTERRAFAGRDRLFIALARADWRSQEQPELESGIAAGAIEALSMQRRFEEAGSFLPRVAPEKLVLMAIERTYEPLWPAIEQRLGAHSTKAADRFAATALDTFANQPANADARRNATRALLLLGRFNDAATTARGVTLSTAMSEADVATIRYGARALAAEGRNTAAIERLRALTAVDAAQVPAIAAGSVDLAELLDGAGRADEALSVARTALSGEGKAVSAWGAGWLRRSEVCALVSLGRNEDAARAGEALTANAASNPPAAIEGLLCLGRSDDAARLVASTLADRDGAQLLADQFQPAEALWATRASRLRALWLKLRERPDVQSAFNKAARVLPKALWPERQPRPIPRIARPDDLPVT